MDVAPGSFNYPDLSDLQKSYTVMFTQGVCVRESLRGIGDLKDQFWGSLGDWFHDCWKAWLRTVFAWMRVRFLVGEARPKSQIETLWRLRSRCSCELSCWEDTYHIHITVIPDHTFHWLFKLVKMKSYVNDSHSSCRCGVRNGNDDGGLTFPYMDTFLSWRTGLQASHGLLRRIVEIFPTQKHPEKISNGYIEWASEFQYMCLFAAKCWKTDDDWEASRDNMHEACFQNLEEVQQRLNDDVRKMRPLSMEYLNLMRERTPSSNSSREFKPYSWGQKVLWSRGLRLERCVRCRSEVVDVAAYFLHRLGDITLFFTNSCSPSKVLCMPVRFRFYAGTKLKLIYKSDIWFHNILCRSTVLGRCKMSQMISMFFCR